MFLYLYSSPCFDKCEVFKRFKYCKQRCGDNFVSIVSYESLQD